MASSDDAGGGEAALSPLPAPLLPLGRKPRAAQSRLPRTLVAVLAAAQVLVTYRSVVLAVLVPLLAVLFPRGIAPIKLGAATAASCALAPLRLAPRALAPWVAAIATLRPEAMERRLQLLEPSDVANAALTAKQELVTLGRAKDSALAEVGAAGRGRWHAWMRRTCVEASAGLEQLRLSRVHKQLAAHSPPGSHLRTNPSPATATAAAVGGVVAVSA